MKNKKSIGIIIAVVFVLLVGIVGGTGDTTGNENTSTTDYSEQLHRNTEIATVAGSNSQDRTETIATSDSTVKSSTTSRQGEETTEKEIFTTTKVQNSGGSYKVALNSIPGFSGQAYTVVNNNIPGLSADDRISTYFENYSPLDSFGRCGIAFACLGKETMPTEEREAIGSVKPSGWHTVKYDIVDGRYLYNRCHLIGFQLSAENANTRNLITGTRYLNMQGMLPFENMVADYIKETDNHVLYRVTPIFKGTDLVCRGVQIEAYSVEDDGDGICFNVFCYNNQPGISIDYATGDSWLDGETEETQKNAPETKGETTTKQETTTKAPDTSQQSTIQETHADESMVWVPQSGKKYHSDSTCSGMKNPREITVDEAENSGYTPCKKCY